ACSAEENPDVPVTTVAISGTGVSAGKLSMRKGATAQLTATVNPSNATYKTVTWTSSDTAVATMANGKVTGVKAGTATVTATAGGKSASVTVTVTGDDIVPVTSVAISGATGGKLSVKKGATAQLTATVNPSNATYKTVTWTSSDTAVATVANGKVTGVKAGTATVTATAGGKSASVTITVTNPDGPADGIDIVGLDGDTTTLSWKYSRQITVRETDGSDFTSVSWTLSSRNAFAFSSWGGGQLGGTTFNKTVTGRTVVIEPQYGDGTATLTVKATRADGTVLTAEKTLINDGGDSPSPASSISLSGNGLITTNPDDKEYSLAMNAGTTTRLTTSVSPADGNQHVIWYALKGDASVATIDADGTVYARKAGTITYVAYTPSRIATVAITVK
ncbi:Ig-like domain-containing protein, partial [Bifidobacterium angulatum]|uniref:Ig-like domain-containing protein n=1 Tax=Bifidobacterium angulatum TaxID=1683 RepID=UPI00406CFABD